MFKQANRSRLHRNFEKNRKEDFQDLIFQKDALEHESKIIINFFEEKEREVLAWSNKPGLNLIKILRAILMEKLREQRSLGKFGRKSRKVDPDIATILCGNYILSTRYLRKAISAMTRY